VVARQAKSRGKAGGHKARPYAQRFRFNFEGAQDQVISVSHHKGAVHSMLVSLLITGKKTSTRGYRKHSLALFRSVATAAIRDQGTNRQFQFPECTDLRVCVKRSDSGSLEPRIHPLT
jgi:hypothetical protein